MPYKPWHYLYLTLTASMFCSSPLVLPRNDLPMCCFVAQVFIVCFSPPTCKFCLMENLRSLSGDWVHLVSTQSAFAKWINNIPWQIVLARLQFYSIHLWIHSSSLKNIDISIPCYTSGLNPLPSIISTPPYLSPNTHTHTTSGFDSRMPCLVMKLGVSFMLFHLPGRLDIHPSMAGNSYWLLPWPTKLIFHFLHCHVSICPCGIPVVKNMETQGLPSGYLHATETDSKQIIT
jgi:hypothetical protein